MSDVTVLRPARRPTLYFIGVTTGQSSIMKVFPGWARELGLEDAAIAGIDLPLHADPAAYREAVQFIRADRMSLGALITTHKIDLFAACRDQFDEIDAHALLLEETSCLSKRGAKLICHAKDPISCGLALDGILGPGYFARTGGDLFVMGAGGSAIAITWHLMREERGPDIPRRIVVSDPDSRRLDAIRRIHRQVPSSVPVDYMPVDGALSNDAVVATLGPHSMVINATGLGKDVPGSPLTGNADFPHDALVWDLNYRGKLLFLDQARHQAASRRLKVVDGWTYFIHGWSRVIAEVFDISIPTEGPGFQAMSDIAARLGRG